MKKTGFILSLAFFILPALPAWAYAGNNKGTQTDEVRYVSDSAGILTYEEWAELEQEAREISEIYSCGTYIFTLDDYRDFGDTADDACISIYEDYAMGYGSDQDGIMLLLSMTERDYALYSFGSHGNAVFSDYAKDWLCEAFLDDFSENEWADGFEDYLDCCEDFLAEASQATAFGKNDGMVVNQGTYQDDEGGFSLIMLLAMIVFPCAFSGILCFGWLSQMKSVRRQTEASAYIAAGSTMMKISEDRLTHVTELRQPTAGRVSGRSGMRPGGSFGGGSFHGSFSSGSRPSGRSGKF